MNEEGYLKNAICPFPESQFLFGRGILPFLRSEEGGVILHSRKVSHKREEERGKNGKNEKNEKNENEKNEMIKGRMLMTMNGGWRYGGVDTWIEEFRVVCQSWR